MDIPHPQLQHPSAIFQHIEKVKKNVNPLQSVLHICDSAVNDTLQLDPTPTPLLSAIFIRRDREKHVIDTAQHEYSSSDFGSVVQSVARYRRPKLDESLI